MPGYVIVQIEIFDQEKFKDYLKESPGIIAKYGGKYLARGGETALLEGEPQAKRVVIIEFPSLERAKDWYFSNEYQRLKHLRDDSAKGTLIAIQGC